MVTTRALTFGEVICQKEPIFQKPKNNYPLVVPYTDLPEENQKFLEMKMTEHKNEFTQENKMVTISLVFCFFYVKNHRKVVSDLPGKIIMFPSLPVITLTSKCHNFFFLLGRYRV